MKDVQNHKVKFSFGSAIVTLSVLLMIYVNSSYNLPVISGTTTLGVSMVCGLLIIIVRKKGIKVNRYLFLSVIVLSICILITSIFTNDTSKDLLIMLSAIWISFIFVIGLEFNRYCKVFTNIMLIIAVYSLIAYFLSIMAPSIIRLFPSAYFRPGAETYNLGLTFINLHGDLRRNMGFFWEPGAYQTYLILAILIELFSNKTRNFVLLVFFLSLITTWSTTGLITSLLLFLIMIINRNRKSNIKSAKIIIAITILSISLVTVYSILPQNIQYIIFGKISLYLNNGSSNVTSASVRFDSVKYPLQAFLKSPFIGVGNTGLKESMYSTGHNMTTNTPSNWFATYGAFFGIIFCAAIFNFSKKLNKNVLLSILIAVAVTLSISTENYLTNISIIIFLLYGLTEPIRIKKSTRKVGT